MGKKKFIILTVIFEVLAIVYLRIMNVTEISAYILATIIVVGLGWLTVKFREKQYKYLNTLENKIKSPDTTLKEKVTIALVIIFGLIIWSVYMFFKKKYSY